MSKISSNCAHAKIYIENLEDLLSPEGPLVPHLLCDDCQGYIVISTLMLLVDE